MRALVLLMLSLSLCACPRNRIESPPAEQYHVQCVQLIQAGDLTQASINCEHCLEYVPDHPECLQNLGVIEQARANFDQAKGFYIRSLRANPDLAQAYQNLGVIALEHERDFKTAQDRFLAALRINPDYAEARHALGLTYLKLNDFDAAEKTFRHLIASAPQLAAGYLNLGAIELMRKHFEGAVPWFEKALLIKRDYPEAHKGLAAAKEALGRREEARDAWESCVELTPEDVQCAEGLTRTR